MTTFDLLDMTVAMLDNLDRLLILGNVDCRLI